MNPTPEQPQPPLAATRRHDVAMGVSPWIRETHRAASPEGATCGEPIDGHVAPLGLGNRGRFVDHGLAPMATTYRPVGTETQFAEPAKLEHAIKANLEGLGSKPPQHERILPPQCEIHAAERQVRATGAMHLP